MKVEINHAEKHIDIWAGHSDLNIDIRSFRMQYPDYEIAIFRSGSENLAVLTANLLAINKK